MPEPDTPLGERPWEDVRRMLDVDAARTLILSAFSPLEAVELPLVEACGMVLAEEVLAAQCVPPFRNSAMDGYAVRAADTAGATWSKPVTLKVVGQVAAGQASAPSVMHGAAVRIMTGAMLPGGADAVVRFEESNEASGVGDGEPDLVKIFRQAKRFDNVREAGEDIAAGTIVGKPGETIGPPHLGVFASVGRTTVRVHRRPVVAVLSTGNEVVEPGDELAPGTIRDSNAYVIAAMASRWGASVRMLGIARDTVTDVTDKLDQARDADLIVTSGGVSLGDYDLVKDVLRAEGTVAIWQVRMKPGKPLAFGQVGGTPLIGLPGNPVAAAVSFLLFGRPAIGTMLGFNNSETQTIEAISAERLDNRGQRRHYVRVRLDKRDCESPLALPVGEQGAGVLSSLAAADALLVIPEEMEVVEAGTRLRAIPLDW